MYPSDLTDDPELARGDKLVRWGSSVPTLGFCVLGLTSRLVISSRSQWVAAMLILSAIGQLGVWWGMNSLRRSRGWDSGVLFWIWAGGVLAAIVAASTAIPAVVPVPLLAPLVATFARFRMRRAAKKVGAAR
jgi:hypothetical protein